MKKDKLHSEKFKLEQEVTLKFASTFKNGHWQSYSKEEKWIVDSVTPSVVVLHLKGHKNQKHRLLNEDISSGFVRIVKTNE